MKVPGSKPWAVYTDWSGVTNLGGNNGGFETELQAVEYLVGRLEGERDEVVMKLHRAKRLRTRLLKGAQP